MNSTIQSALEIAGIGIGGIFIFMAMFYFLIIGIDKWFPFQEEKPVEELAGEDYEDSEEE